MYLSQELIEKAVDAIAFMHPFFGVTYFVFTKEALPIGETVSIRINFLEREFLDRHCRPDISSGFYFQPFRSRNKSITWVAAKKYASSTIQTFRTQTFSDAFIHPKDTDEWGWKENYLDELRRLQQRHQKRKTPSFSLAVWLFRDREWAESTTPENIIEALYREFNISQKEQDYLFDDTIPESVAKDVFYQLTPITLNSLRKIIGYPPDAPVEEGGTLAYLNLKGIGPAQEIEFEPGTRLNLITGDNGLGKTFILETSWWSLTGHWPSERPALPRTNTDDASITFEIASEQRNTKRVTISYDWQAQTWPVPQERPTLPGFLIFARVDGSFSVWDPRRIEPHISSLPRALNFAKEEVWNGLEENMYGQTRFYSNGLLRDWISWQNRPSEGQFEIFKKVLRRLSPNKKHPIEPGAPTRLPYDARDIPTVTQPYGIVPIIHAAAGIQRIVAMAYLIVWAWTEHQTLSRQQRKEPQERLVVLVDEMEAHLHPRWQRVILPALLEVSEDLAQGLQVQFIVATHSPLIMASAEPIFNVEMDKLFHLDLVQSNLFSEEVVLEEIPFIKYGPGDSWLMSDVFELNSTGSVESEEAIERAKSIQLQNDPNHNEIKKIDQELKRLLAVDHEFWPLWKYFAEQHGVRV